MGCKKITITGAPGTGKTVVIEALQNKGYHCYPEVIRTMTAKEKLRDTGLEIASNPLVFVDDPMAFNQQLLSQRIAQYEHSFSLKESFCFFDRGIPDVLAYMDYFGQSYDISFIEAAEKHPYDQLFIMPPWKEIYSTDNERLETFAQAEALDECLMNTYTSLGYEPVVVPKMTIEKRVTFILEELNQK